MYYEEAGWIRNQSVNLNNVFPIKMNNSNNVQSDCFKPF